MSSKPDTGINHKEFGVTSEGVIVFLHHALQEIGIQPETDPFTVAMTGGPDGDVGGNAIKILLREYGAQVRIVAIADGTGAAHDPNGLEPQELTRLVEQERGIVHFNEARLGPGGNVFDLASESGLAFRNNLPFMVKSDVFLPAGGRPSTINQSNSHQFLDSDGTPNARVIVEGANLFITEQARRHLSERGVLIVKDSSANKCGVICSSLEIISGMLLTAEQFQSIKPEFVDDILNLLRRLARIEAISLFNEYARGGGQTLPELSVELSRQIIRIADIVTLDMETWQEPEQQLANRLMIDFLPASLCKAVGPDLASKIPSVYRAQLLSALIASKLVYREGIRNLCDVPAPRLSQLARQQLVCEVDILDLIDQVRSSDAPHADKLVSILEHAGARAQRELRLGY